MDKSNLLKLLFSLSLLASSTLLCPLPATAQKKEKPRRAPNLAINLATGKDTARTAYLNLGIMTSHIYQQRGVGLNVLWSAVQEDMDGCQISGLVNATGRNASGMQLGGLVNIAGKDANGLMLGGLTNIAGKDANGVMLGGLANIAGKDANGVMLGGLANIAGKDANGVMLGGLANIAGKDANGLMVGGLLNIAGRNAQGVQLAGLGNVGSTVNGMQLAAASNIASRKLTGVQACAAVNIAIEMEHAFQLAGLTNICQGTMQGTQLALGNYAGEVKGAQIGLLNLCSGEVKGVQIGIINHSKDTTAHKIGLVNINPHTRIQLLVYGGNTSKTNVAVRFKNRKTYTILGIGTHYLGLNEKFSGCLGYRAGMYFPLGHRLEVSGDLGYFHIENFENENTDTPERMYSLQARINLEYRLRKRAGLFVSGGYGMTRYYDRNKFYEKKPIVEVGLSLF